MLTQPSRSFAVGDWLVEPTLNRISTASECLHLRPQLMEVLVYLAELEGQVASLESIHDNLWPGKIVTSGAIYNCIAELRQAFARNGRDVEYIETVPKKGYRLSPPIVSRQSETGSKRDACSIAILPLANRGDETEIQYLCEGIAEELLFGLSRIDGLRVYSAKSLGSEGLDARVAGLRYNARLVLSGSLQADGRKLRAILHLESVSDGEIVWSGRFDHTIDSLLELQESLASQVLEALSPSLPARSTDRLLPEGCGTRNLEAFNTFLMGKHALSRSTRQSHQEAITLFERAVGLDPAFARAHYLLYLANYMKCRHFGAGAEAIEKARLAARNAEANGFSPAVPWIHIHRRLHPDDRLSSRELAIEAIERLREGNAEWGSFAYEQLTWVLSDAGLFNATLDFAERMLALPDYRSEDSDAEEEVPHYAAACGEFEKAILQWSSLIQKEPTRPLFRCERSILYSRTGQFEYAMKDIDRVASTRHAILSRAFLAYYRGDTAELIRQHDQLLNLSFVQPAFLLWAHCLTGNLDKSLEKYEESVNEKYRSFIDFGNMRAMSRAKLPIELVEKVENHPRFKRLMKQTGIDDAWQAELVERVNEISDITGIIVRPG